MKIIAITGSIATGKSFVAKAFVKFGAVLFDADKNVHEILSSESEVFQIICEKFPESYINGEIARKILSEIVFKDNAKREQLENIIYPILDKKRDIFLNECRKNHVEIVVMEIPLLFEKNKQNICDYVVVTKADAETQQKRALSRKNMSLEKFNAINSLQIPTIDKINRADFVIDTTVDEISLYKQVESIIVKISQIS